MRTVVTVVLVAAGLALPLRAALADEPASKPVAESNAQKPAEAKPQRCEPLTGSRLRPDPSVNGCKPGPGLRIYELSDLRETGEPTTAEALVKLDPSLSLGRR